MTLQAIRILLVNDSGAVRQALCSLDERAMRAVALGRKNYLFAGSDIGGERAATLYSLIGSAKLTET